MRYSCITENGEHVSGEVIEIIELPELQVIRIKLDNGEVFDALKRRPTKHARRRGDSHRIWEDTPGQFEPGDEDLFKPTPRG